MMSNVEVVSRIAALDLPPIAAGLGERGIPAARGGKWSAVQVARIAEGSLAPDAIVGSHVGTISIRTSCIPGSVRCKGRLSQLRSMHGKNYETRLRSAPI